MREVDCAPAVTVFQRRERDGIDYVRCSPNDIWRATNFQRLAFTGVEAEVALRPARDRRKSVGSTPASAARRTRLAARQSKYVFNYPVHSGIVSWQGAFAHGLRCPDPCRGRCSGTSATPMDCGISTPRGTAAGIRPFLQLSNVTSTSYQEIPGVAMPGRSVLGGIEMLSIRVAVNWVQKRLDSTRGISLRPGVCRRPAGPGTRPTRFKRDPVQRDGRGERRRCPNRRPSSAITLRDGRFLSFPNFAISSIPIVGRANPSTGRRTFRSPSRRRRAARFQAELHRGRGAARSCATRGISGLVDPVLSRSGAQ